MLKQTNPVDMYADATVEIARLQDKIKYLQMQVDLCHLWLDAADVPRFEDGHHNSKRRRKSLLQRLAIFMARWVDMENYVVLRDNIDNLIRDPSGKNLYLRPLQESVDEDEIPE